MLHEKKATEPTIMTMKLSTGEEIIALVVEFTPSEVKVKNPLAMVLAENPENPTQVRVMFTTWMAAADNDATVSIRGSHIVAGALPKEAAAEQYRAATAN